MYTLLQRIQHTNTEVLQRTHLRTKSLRTYTQSIRTQMYIKGQLIIGQTIMLGYKQTKDTDELHS